MGAAQARATGSWFVPGAAAGRTKIDEVREREVRDLPWRKYQADVVRGDYRVRCPKCGLKVEKFPQLPSKAPFSKDFEEAVGLACEAAAARQVARQFGLAASTVRAIDLRYLERWAQSRKKPVLRQMGVDEIYLGKTAEVSDGGEQSGDGRALVVRTGAEGGDAGRVLPDAAPRDAARGIEAACVDMWKPFTTEHWSSGHRKAASSMTSFTLCSTPSKPSTRCGEPSFSAKGDGSGIGEGEALAVAEPLGESGPGQKRQLNELFRLNRRVMKAYLLKESLDRLWNYRYEGAMLNGT